MDLNKALSSFGVSTKTDILVQAQENSSPKNPSREGFDFDINLQEQIAYLNRIGASMSLTPPKVRKKTLALEERFTAAANQKDEVRFLDLVKQWVDAFAAYAPGDASRTE